MWVTEKNGTEELTVPSGPGLADDARRSWLTIIGLPVFVSVAFKGFSLIVSPLLATFTERSMSVAVKGVKATVSNADRAGMCKTLK
jgi:hypothetical protein